MNRFIASLADGPPKLGLWQSLASPYAAEVCAGCGFDWLLFDGEHAPNTVQTMLAQLQAVAPYPLEPIARVPADVPWIIKQYLDIGFRTLLVPTVESVEQAERIVAATRFPPRGLRGVASATSRASGFGADSRYLVEAHETTAVIVQIETAAGLAALEAIAAVDGIDALFIGPLDLSASLGHLGHPRAPEAQAAISDALARIARTGKPAGVFALDADDARRRVADGARFVAVGTDIGLLTTGAAALRTAVGS